MKWTRFVVSIALVGSCLGPLAACASDDTNDTQKDSTMESSMDADANGDDGDDESQQTGEGGTDIADQPTAQITKDIKEELP